MHVAPRLRVAAAALALLFFGGDLASGLHAVVEPHAVCPEHGEQVHAGEASPGNGSAEEGQEDASSDEHDHCRVLASRTRLPQTGASSVPARAVSEVAPIAERGFALPATSLLRLAPKTSPPSA